MTTEVERMSIVRAQGYDSGNDGKLLSMNPYEEDSKEWVAWCEGWNVSKSLTRSSWVNSIFRR